MKTKNQSISFLKKFYVYVETQFHCSVQTIQSDNERELCEGEAFQNYFQKEIFHYKSCTDTPNKTGLLNANIDTFWKLQEQ